MRALSIIAVCLALVATAVADGPSSVVVLTDSNFEELTQAATGATTGRWFVEFYAPWCGHCKNLIPEWEKLARDIKADGAPVSVAKIDCTEHTSTAHRFGIKGFPTLKLLVDGKVYDYNGQRKAADMKKFALNGYLSSKDAAPVPKPVGAAEYVWDLIVTALQDAMMMISRKPEVAAILMGLGIVFGVIISILVYSLVTPAPVNGVWSPQPQPRGLAAPVAAAAGGLVSGVPLQTVEPAAAAAAAKRAKKAE